MNEDFALFSGMSMYENTDINQNVNEDLTILSDTPMKKNINTVTFRYNENKLRSLQKLDDNNNNLIDFSSNDYISYARNRKIAKRVDILYNDYINNNKDNIPILGSTGSRYVFIINYL